MTTIWEPSAAQGTLKSQSVDAPQGLQVFTFTAGDLSTADLTATGDNCLRVLMTLESLISSIWLPVKRVAWCSCEHATDVPEIIWIGYAAAVRLEFDLSRKVNAISWSVASAPSMGTPDPSLSFGPLPSVATLEDLVRRLVTAARA